MKRSLLKVFTISLLIISGFFVTIQSIDAFGFESGNFKEGTTHYGTYGIYSGTTRVSGWTYIKATSYAQTTATTSVSSPSGSGSVTGTQGGTQQKRVEVGFSGAVRYTYAGGLTN